MLLIISLAGAAALTVIAYSRLRARSPEAADAAVAAAKQLAAVVLVCARAVEHIVDALQPPRAVYATSGRPWGYDDYYDEEE